MSVDERWQKSESFSTGVEHSYRSTCEEALSPHSLFPLSVSRTLEMLYSRRAAATNRLHLKFNVEYPLQVAPAELEDLIRQLPDVADVGVVGMPVDRATGEAPRAFVVLTPGSQLSLKAIEDFVECKVAPHKKLAGGLEYVDAIPRSPTGKILRRELKQMALSRYAQ